MWYVSKLLADELVTKHLLASWKKKKKIIYQARWNRERGGIPELCGNEMERESGRERTR